jgi:DnaJ-class molecular chaperone
MCADCEGDAICPKCGGAGEIEDPPFYEAGPAATPQQCPACFGHPVMSASDSARISRNIERFRRRT